MKKSRLLRAALAGLTAGLAAPHASLAEDAAGDVKCYGVNGCGAQARCSVSSADIEAVRALIGANEFKTRFGKSEAHSCGAHAKCGSGSQILNWVNTSASQCSAQGGFLIEEGKDKKKVAKKA
jgi:hypothetical protein